MKKKQISFKTIAAYVLGLAILAIIGFNVHLVMESQKKLTDSDVTLKNIEALSEESNAPKKYRKKCREYSGKKTVTRTTILGITIVEECRIYDVTCEYLDKNGDECEDGSTEEECAPVKEE